MTCVVDASLVVAALISRGPERQWSESLIATEELAAPHLMLAEASNLLRRAALFRDVGDEQATQAYSDLMVLPVSLFPFLGYESRVWDLRHTVTAYDAWYVALAEDLGVPLATVDQRLIRSSGPRCQFLTFQG